MTEAGEEGEAMQVHEDYWNWPYQLPTLTLDQQEDLALMAQKRVYAYEYMDSFEQCQEPQLSLRDFYSSLAEEDTPEGLFIWEEFSRCFPA